MMTMQLEKHLFDTKSRVSADEAQELELGTWQPPTVNAAGHLVHAETKPAPKLNEAAAEAANAQNNAALEKQTFEEAKAKGYQEGLAQGKQEGNQQAQQQAQQQMQAQLQPKLKELNTLLTTLAHSLNEEDYKLEQTLLQLVKQIAEAVIGHEMKTDPGQIMKVIRDTLSALPPSKDNIAKPEPRVTKYILLKRGGVRSTSRRFPKGLPAMINPRAIILKDVASTWLIVSPLGVPPKIALASFSTRMS